MNTAAWLVWTPAITPALLIALAWSDGRRAQVQEGQSAASQLQRHAQAPTDIGKVTPTVRTVRSSVPSR